ncbi:MAG: hypothetical protein Q8P23_01040 [bacterium]|nr:hypothetical protein [bacterium]
MAKIGILTVPRSNELIWTAAGIAAGFIVPALEKKIGGDRYSALAPEIQEGVGALTNALIATGIGVASTDSHALEYAKGSIGVAAVKTTAMLVRRTQNGGGFPFSRQSRGPSALSGQKPRRMLDSVNRSGQGGPMRLLFTVDQSSAEQLS